MDNRCISELHSWYSSISSSQESPTSTYFVRKWGRFNNNNLAGNVEILLSKLNLYMAGALPEDINPENEEIDGTKEEADANKMTFV